MTPLAFAFSALVCSIFVTTSETTNHVHDIADELYDDDIMTVNPKLAHLYGNHEFIDNPIINDAIDGHRQPITLRHYNVNVKNKKKNNDNHIFMPDDSHKAKIHVYKKDIDRSHVNRDLNAKEETIETTRMRHYNVNARRKRETNTDPRCLPFTYVPGNKRLTHPKALGDHSKPGEGKYAGNITCFTTIEAEPGQVIELTFVDVFEIEDSPKCKNDYLEIRNGRFGYALPVYNYCGRNFPPQITSTGPYMWLKFHSDEIIEYAGFTIEIDFPPKTTSKAIDHSCYKRISGTSGLLDGTSDSPDLRTCRDQTIGPLDVQWRIETDPGTQIYLNITRFQLANTNNCTLNKVQIFGSKPNFDHLLGEYCSSVAKSLWTEETKKHPGPANIMYIRLYTIDRKSNFSAIFTKFRTADECNKDEYDCKDATCIDKALRCDGTAHCRLKADEDPVDCKGEAQSLVRDKDTRTILIVFSLILSAMIFVFLFKCIRKFYYDQKQINEHRAQLCDYLNKAASQLTLDPKSRDFRQSSGSGSTSLQQQNHANERNRHLHQQKSSSLESDFLRIPVDDDWPESVPILSDDRRHYKGRPTRDLSGKEETLRGKDSKEEKQSRDVSVGVQELQEAECQTRVSLYQTAPIVPRTTVPGQKSSDSRSGVASPSPAPTTPKLTVELLRQATAQDTGSSQADARPLSSETTKSAPDVIQIY